MLSILTGFQKLGIPFLVKRHPIGDLLENVSQRLWAATIFYVWIDRRGRKAAFIQDRFYESWQS